MPPAAEPTLAEKLARTRASTASRAKYARPLSVPGATAEKEGDDGKPAVPVAIVADPEPIVRHARRRAGAAVARRARKDAPREVSSRRPVPCGRARCLGEEERTKRGVDPRFAEHCLEEDEGAAGVRYGFVGDMLEKEVRELRRVVQNGGEGREELARMEREVERRKVEERRGREKAEARKAEKAKVADGKMPWFDKAGEVREREAFGKYEELKKTGGVQKFIEKRRKRSAAKDRKLLPERRR